MLRGGRRVAQTGKAMCVGDVPPRGELRDVGRVDASHDISVVGVGLCGTQPVVGPLRALS